jgi:hypothetical protein
VSAVGDAGRELVASYSETEILAFVRTIAARRDPGRGVAYLGVSPARIKHAAAVAQQLLQLHLDYRRQYRHGRGRRVHSAAVYDHLAQINDASLVLALVWLDAAFALLPPGTTDD